MKVFGCAFLVAVGTVAAVFGVLAVRDATMSTHHSVAPGSKVEVVLDVTRKGGERGQTMSEIVEAHLLLCRLEVSSDVVGPVEVVGPDRYRAVLTPSMDESNRRQFRGCLEDLAIDHARLDVVRMSRA